MSQRRIRQNGTFHITTNVAEKFPWCTCPGVPDIIIDNLVMTRNLQGALVHAFCILPNHMHIILSPGERGLSEFMRSFKTNSSHDVAEVRGPPLRLQHKIKWQKSFHDEYLRNGRQITNAMNYVHFNALRHKLVNDINHWPWTSLHFSNVIDPVPMEALISSPFDFF